MSEDEDEYWTPRKVAALERAVKRLWTEQPEAVEKVMEERGFTEGEARAYLVGVGEGRGR